MVWFYDKTRLLTNETKHRKLDSPIKGHYLRRLRSSDTNRRLYARTRGPVFGRCKVLAKFLKLRLSAALGVRGQVLGTDTPSREQKNHHSTPREPHFYPVKYRAQA